MTPEEIITRITEMLDGGNDIVTTRQHVIWAAVNHPNSTHQSDRVTRDFARAVQNLIDNELDKPTDQERWVRVRAGDNIECDGPGLRIYCHRFIGNNRAYKCRRRNPDQRMDVPRKPKNVGVSSVK